MKGTIYTTAIVGGGAAGLFAAAFLTADIGKTAIFERGERVGKKVAATGNGQGNATNLYADEKAYFSSSDDGKLQEIIKAYPPRSCMAALEEMGLLLVADERGRVYPAGRQASAISDALRFQAAANGVETHVNARVVGIAKEGDIFVLTVQTAAGETQVFAKNVLLCTGGKAAKNFGTDGTGYALATAHGHTLTGLYPSLVQLKTDTKHIKTLKGIRAANVGVTATWREKGATYTEKLVGDVIFTDYGVSGDAIFRLSAWIADKQDAQIAIDLLPDHEEECVLAALRAKKKRFPAMEQGELLCGMVNNQIARAVMKRAEGDMEKAAAIVKGFVLPVTGSLGFDYAQVTKGGLRLDEVDENLQSRFVDGLYLAGEALDVDGQCGGFNLHWAYASARRVAQAIEKKERERV